jgi:hypothetical protein
MEKEAHLGMTDWSKNVDKVYKLYLKEHHSGAGYQVISKYGRRYSTLTTHDKTKGPVPYGTANTMYNNLLHSKLSKGYEYE